MALADGYRLEDRYELVSGDVFLTGIQALARLPIDQLRADRRRGHSTAAFVSGYQGSPLGGLGAAVESAAASATDLPIVFEQAVNEELAATAVMGSQLASARPDARYDGVVGLWYGKAPGVDRASDALRHAVFAGSSLLGGAVAIVGDDPSAKSSTIPSSSAGLAADMHMPLLYPGDPTEALDLGRHAIAMARSTGLWSALKIVADVADGTASVVLDPDRIQPVFPLHDGVPYEHVPNAKLLTPFSVDIEREIVEVRYELARQYASDNRLNRTTVDPADAWFGIVASGITYREVREALSRVGLDTDDAVASAGIRLLKMGMPMPFNPATIRHFARGLDTVLVVEEKQPNIESLIKDALYALADRPSVVGKADTDGKVLLPAWSALDADILVPVLRTQLSERLGERLIPERPVRERVLIPVAVERAPFFCSGCPHNRSTQVPEGSAVAAGIGCHTMVMFMDEDRVGDLTGMTAMGNEGAQWIGMAPFVETDHLIQNIGDGTFFHSGQLAVQASVAAGAHVTYKLLYNGTVAMTGGQDPQGQLSVGAVAKMMLTAGVAEVLITSDEPNSYDRGEIPAGVEVWDRRRLIEAQERLAAVDGVTVLIHDQACAAEARRARKRGLVATPNQRVVINERICEGCGDCGEVSNCLSVQSIDTPFGSKRTIDQTTCNLDFSCLDGDCPSFMTISTKTPGRLSRWLGRGRSAPSGSAAPSLGVRDAPSLGADDFPAPNVVVPTDDFNLRITGIGGTGVVTVAQIIGTAAMFDGYEVRGLDQIGLSQKAGPVVSDVRLSSGHPSHTSRLGHGQANLLLAVDQLVAASSKGLDTCDPDITVVVGSTSATPTGQMVRDDSTVLPSPAELQALIASDTTAVHHWADAHDLCEQLLGSAAGSNVFVIGLAVQHGCLPIGPERIEQAIELNGVAVEANLQAFRWGRAQAHDPGLVAQHLHTSVPDADEDVAELSAAVVARLDRLSPANDRRGRLARFAVELNEWGGEHETDRWLDALDRVATAEAAAFETNDGRLLDAVAAGLFKLTAYKDEYEVARLMTSDAANAGAREVAGANGAIAWRLHPPVLRAMGMQRKIEIGAWATPAVRQLARARGLRGTLFDPFRWAEVRKVERELADEYRAAIDRVLKRLSADNLDAAVALAELPDIVRGYEDIKLNNVREYRTRLASALASFEAK